MIPLTVERTLLFGQVLCTKNLVFYQPNIHSMIYRLAGVHLSTFIQWLAEAHITIFKKPILRTSHFLSRGWSKDLLKLTCSPIRLCNILMITPKWQLISNPFFYSSTLYSVGDDWLFRPLWKLILKKSSKPPQAINNECSLSSQRVWKKLPQAKQQYLRVDRLLHWTELTEVSNASIYLEGKPWKGEGKSWLG